MAFPKNFKPSKKFGLIRLGKDNDGGYLVGKKTILKTKFLVSLGIGDDCSFEKDILKLNNKINIYCYDRFPLSKNYFIKEIIKSLVVLDFHNISHLLKVRNDYKKIFRNNNVKKRLIRYKSLIKIIKENNISSETFLKVDIEGAEYRILDEILENQKIFTGIILEFHDVDFHKEKIKTFINSLKLDLTHIHVNNSSVIDLENDATCIELTFEKNPEILGENPILPHPLDQKSFPYLNDKPLNFEQ
jgi:hypothetical protein